MFKPAPQWGHVKEGIDMESPQLRQVASFKAYVETTPRARRFVELDDELVDISIDFTDDWTLVGVRLYEHGTPEPRSRYYIAQENE